MDSQNKAKDTVILLMVVSGRYDSLEQQNMSLFEEHFCSYDIIGGLVAYNSLFQEKTISVLPSGEI
jgi:hypothetical protein